MNNNWDEAYKNTWNERYSEAGYAYGKTPNHFFRTWLQKETPGAILMPADGEGRNGVYAASLGWNVTSFDLSTPGREKALQLAKEYGVNLEYITGDLEQLSFTAASFDAIGLIYAHFAAEKKAAFHRKLDQYLKPGGMVIFEAFSKNHLHYKSLNSKVGGPGAPDMLFSKEEIAMNFENYEMLLLTEEEVYLEEGPYHQGKGSVIRFAGRKHH